MVLMIAVLICVPLLSQPGTGNSFSVYRNIAYSKKENSSLLLDIYIPGGKSMAAGIGITGKVTNQNTLSSNVGNSPPIVIWLPGKLSEIFPTPVASFAGNGYAIVSMQYENDTSIIRNISEALKYFRDNPATYNLSTLIAGIIQQDGKDYFALIWNEEAIKMKSLSDASLKISIPVQGDHDFSKLEASENISIITGFFDKYLRNGVHQESDPLSLKCPPDSWVDPITNPIPGTIYHLFPTPSRGKGTEGSYLIYLPKDYSSSNNRYPVIYWLHGGNGNSREGAWMCEKMNEAMQKGDMPHCIVVFVQGLPIGWYNNSIDGTMPVEDVIIKDLIPHIDATYRTIANRAGRGIDGMSMGGYGSLHLGFKYPELFGVVSSIAPSITTYEMERKEVILPTFGNDTAYFNRNSPSTLVELNDERIKGKTSIRLLIGDKDFLFNLLQEFHLKMQKFGLDHQYSVAKDAGHDYREVITKLEGNSFIFWKEAFRNFR